VKKAAELLALLLDKGPPGALPFPALFGGWQELAGPSLAEHCRAYEVRHRCLLVECDHPGWMQLLLMQKKPLLVKIRQRFAQLGIRDIKARVGSAGGARQPVAGERTPAAAARQAASGPPALPPAAEPRRPEAEAAESAGRSGSAPNQAAAKAPDSAEIRRALEAVGDAELRQKLRLLLQELERRIDTGDRK
jgi:hypothetical protein